MFLKNISITAYKSHGYAEFTLAEGLNFITGNNGVGKTNLLDAIYCLLNGRSYFQPNDSLCIKQNEAYYTLKGSLESEENSNKLMVSFVPGQRKAISINDEKVTKLAQYFGKFPCVVIAPDDVEIINGESELRRKFFDYLLSLTHQGYLQNLVNYNKYLDIRNKQLKLFLEHDSFDADLLNVYNEKLATYGNEVYKVRKAATPEFELVFNKTYQLIAGTTEQPVFEYLSGLNHGNFELGFTQNLQKDRYTGRTNFGIHRDDWNFTLNTLPLKKTGSQGQIKSFLISLKLAMYHYICSKRSIKPLLLLDDIFEKIDTHRMNHLLEIIKGEDFGQVVITDTSKKRIQDYLGKNTEYEILEL